jgi:hypothetical protein
MDKRTTARKDAARTDAELAWSRILGDSWDAFPDEAQEKALEAASSCVTDALCLDGLVDGLDHLSIDPNWESGDEFERECILHNGVAKMERDAGTAYWFPDGSAVLLVDPDYGWTRLDTEGHSDGTGTWVDADDFYSESVVIETFLCFGLVGLHCLRGRRDTELDPALLLDHRDATIREWAIANLSEIATRRG